MVRMCVTLSENDLENFERGRSSTGMNKSSYIRLLIAEHERRVPAFWKNKELIEKLSDLNTSVKELILTEKINDADKLLILEKINKLTEKVDRIASA